jgi:hypothetical protein
MGSSACAAILIALRPAALFGRLRHMARDPAAPE